MALNGTVILVIDRSDLAVKWTEDCGFSFCADCRGLPLADLLTPQDLDDIISSGEGIRYGLSIPLKEEKTACGMVICNTVTTANEIVLYVKSSISPEKSRQFLERVHHLEHTIRKICSVVHDFNNIITVVSGYADLIKKKSEDNSGKSISHEITSILSSCNKASTLSRSIIALSGENTTRPQYKRYDLIKTLNENINLIRQIISPGITISLRHDSSDCFVFSDGISFDQIFNNLIINAVDAVPEDGGEIDIFLRNILTEGRPQIEIRISDNGKGIEPEFLTRVFDPFFTTKNKDNGTGLGLYAVRSLINGMGGSVSVESVVGTGTVFKILIPK